MKMHLVTLICEAMIIVVNILIFSKMTVFKNDNSRTKLLISILGAGIMAVYFAVMSLGILPDAFAMFVCVTLPEFLIFMSLSKYKDFRFIVTFCFVDSVMLIASFFMHCISYLPGNKMFLNMLSSVCMLAAVSALYLVCKRYCILYCDMMNDLKNGWETTAVSTFLVYSLLVFAAAYPEPLSQRVEYLAVFAFISVTVLSFFAVFIITLHQKRTLLHLNDSLMAEKSWRMIAHSDSLTGMENRTAFVETVNEIEHFSDDTRNVFALMLDINNFKTINDTLGHHKGDEALINAAGLVKKCFEGEYFKSFRIGGDEFAVLAFGVEEELVVEKIQNLKNMYVFEELKCGFSIGFSKVDFSEESAVENAFINADKAMYEEKARIKREAALAVG